MKTRTNTNAMTVLIRTATAALLIGVVALASQAWAGADPGFAFYGYKAITPNPNPAIVGENTHITVTVSNLGDVDAEDVPVMLSFNDWGVTFNGWQPIGTHSVPLIPACGSAQAEFDYVFGNRGHTCLEARIVGANDANMNANSKNDRCQINMEVVNSGKTFEYDVPIVNNGEEDLVLDVRGYLLNQDPNDPNGHRMIGAELEPVDEQIVVPAGEEVLVPVMVKFLPDAPHGTAVDVVVEAFDTAKPGDVNARNHVMLRVVFNSARGLKQDCLAMLGELPPPAVPLESEWLDEIDEIVRNIDGSLDPELWLDDSHLDPNAVFRVFNQEIAAVNLLHHLMALEGVPLEWKMQFEACVRGLTDADRILASTAIQDAGGDAVAEALLQEADQFRLAGVDHRAMRKLRAIVFRLR